MARVLVQREWHLSDPVFDALWNSLAAVPRQTQPGNATADSTIRALASAGAVPEPPTIAVFIFTQLEKDIPGQTTWNALRTSLLEIATRLGYDGMGNFVLRSGDQHPPDRTPSKPDDNYAKIYTNDNPQGRTASKKETEAERRNPERYKIFIYHQAGLPPKAPGIVYLNRTCVNDPGVAGRHHVHRLPPLQYSILKHLLKNQGCVTQRTIAALFAACWNEPLDNRASDQTVKFRRAIATLNDILAQFLPVIIDTRKSICNFDETPTFCVIEETDH